MKIVPIQNCCSGLLLRNMGNGEAVGDSGWYDSAVLDDMTEERAKKTLINWLRKYKAQGYGFIICVTNTAQAKANKILEELGWYCSPECKSTKHPRTPTYVWFMPLCEFEAENEQTHD